LRKRIVDHYQKVCKAVLIIASVSVFINTSVYNFSQEVIKISSDSSDKTESLIKEADDIFNIAVFINTGFFLVLSQDSSEAKNTKKSTNSDKDKSRGSNNNLFFFSQLAELTDKKSL
jgi:hypothetical protein